MEVEVENIALKITHMLLILHTNTICRESEQLSRLLMDLCFWNLFFLTTQIVIVRSLINVCLYS